MYNNIGSKCENCGKQHDGDYGSGRFCSVKCARCFSTKKTRLEINQKVSKTLYGRKQTMTNAKWKAVQRAGEVSHRKWLCRKAKVDGVELDVTNGYIELYRETHPVCEICGRPEKVATSSKGKISKLARDHDHTNNRFRGLLCSDCNRKLGWYEKLAPQIHKYLAA